MRLQKYLADAGVASRRKSEEIIAQGRVRVNGRTVTQMGFVLDGTERIELDGKPINRVEQ
ncbi:rRNA pseudouridine synthase, partial [Clostridia bacterium OttesenSCG-928-F22]|nr:rRNA pseudouridine synthase [Clostridia bacterium OttesenSCG-928-F22]